VNKLLNSSNINQYFPSSFQNFQNFPPEKLGEVLIFPGEKSTRTPAKLRQDERKMRKR